MALNSVCWHLCISKYFKDWNSDEWTTKRTSKDRGQKRTNTGAPFWAYGSDDFLRSVQMVPRPEMTTWSLKDAGASWSGDWLCSRRACALLYQTETDWQHAEVMIISKRMKLSLRCLFTCRGLSGFAGWAWLSVVRICGAVQLSCAHVQKQSFLKVINHGKSITIAKSNSVKHNRFTLPVKSKEWLRFAPMLHLFDQNTGKTIILRHIITIKITVFYCNIF